MSPWELAALVRVEQRLAWMKWMVEQGYVSDSPSTSAWARRKRQRRRALLARAPVRAEVGR